MISCSQAHLCRPPRPISSFQLPKKGDAPRWCVGRKRLLDYWPGVAAILRSISVPLPKIYSTLAANSIQLLAPQYWKDYELIDCGDFEKLERFGNTVLIRPEPQAVWKKGLPESEWTRRADIRFKGRSATSGDWIKKSPKTADRWHIRYQNDRI